VGARGGGAGRKGPVVWDKRDRAGGKKAPGKGAVRDCDMLGTVGGHASCVSKSGSGIVKARLSSQMVRYADAVGRGHDSHGTWQEGGKGGGERGVWQASVVGSNGPGMPRALDMVTHPPPQTSSHTSQSSHFAHPFPMRPLNGHGGFAGGGGGGRGGEGGWAGGAGPVGGRSQAQLVEYWFGRPAGAAAGGCASGGVGQGGKHGALAVVGEERNE